MTEAVTQSAIEQSTPMPTGSVDTGYDEDAELRGVFNQVTRDNGAGRDEDGKFSGKKPGEEASPGPQEPAEETTGSEPAEASGVALPGNWRGMEATWEKIPPDVRAEIAAHQTSIHSKMTEQGRQLTAFRPLQEVIDRNSDLWEGRTAEDGTPADARMAIGFLFEAQRRLQEDPAGSLIEIADRFGARNALIAALIDQGRAPNGGRQPHSQPRQTSAGMSPADVARVVEEKMSEAQMASEYRRLASSKPLFDEIDEQDMVHAITKARTKLGEAASPDAVFDLAYDMAVNADPDLRTKAAAASQPKPAVQTLDPKKTDAAKRANAVNVTSTSSGTAPQLTEEEELRAVFRKANKG
ncbi:MAG: hypothetical protein R3D70_09370 [Rhizobiaceae bacterium]